MKNLKEMLIEKGYKKGNNCYYLAADDNTFYFNMNDEGNFTTVTYEPKEFGGQEIILYDVADIESLEELEETNYILQNK